MGGVAGAAGKAIGDKVGSMFRGKPPAAPEDNDALRASGSTLPAGLTAEQVLALARGETP